MFPSTTLLSTREEWRACAEYLGDLGYRSLLVDWPGWHQRNVPLNWAIEDDIREQTLISTFAKYAYSVLDHSRLEYPNSPINIAVSGANAALHVIRAINELDDGRNSFGSLTCFCPSWRFYLTRWVPEGYPRRLERRRATAAWMLTNCFARSKVAFRMYRSKVGISKLSKRLYEEKIQNNQDLLDSKREVIMRDRPLSLDVAMILGQFNSVSSTPDLLKELLSIDTNDSDGNNNHEDSDDDDGLLNIRVPNSNVLESNPETAVSKRKLFLVFPQDVVPKDKEELSVIREWAEHHGYGTVDIPGRIFCHEESPALSATIINNFISEKSATETVASHVS